MKHLQLFEAFDPTPTRLESLIQSLKEDPQMGHYDLKVLPGGESYMTLVIWTNPAEDGEWRDSGYVEDYDDDLSNVRPMPVLGVFSIFGDDLSAYKLTPEEKYMEKIVLSTDKEGLAQLDPEEIVSIHSLEDFKRALRESIWEMGGPFE